MDSIQVGDGRGRKRLIKPKGGEAKPFWINSDGTVEMDRETSGGPVGQALDATDQERAEAYVKKYIQDNKIPCKGCQGRGFVTVMRYDRYSIPAEVRQKETCRLCTGTGFHPDE